MKAVLRRSARLYLNMNRVGKVKKLSKNDEQSWVDITNCIVYLKINQP